LPEQRARLSPRYKMNLKYFLQIMGKRPALIALLALPGIGNLFLVLNSPLLVNSTLFIELLGLLCIPAIYGVFLEDIDGNNSCLWEEFKKYICLYVFVIITIRLPLIFVALTTSYFEIKSQLPYLFVAIVIEVATIFVLPYAFITKSIKKAVLDGILLICNNAKENKELIVLVIISTILAVTSHTAIKSLFLNNHDIANIISFSFAFFSTFISCIVFLTACEKIKK
jgi:hypothetical protein